MSNDEEIARLEAEYIELLKDRNRREKTNMTSVSRLETEKKEDTNMLASPKFFQQFASDFARHKGLSKVKGRSYKQLVEDIASGEFRQDG